MNTVHVAAVVTVIVGGFFALVYGPIQSTFAAAPSRLKARKPATSKMIKLNKKNSPLKKAESVTSPAPKNSSGAVAPTVSPSATPSAVAPTYGKNSIGYIGCSMSKIGVDGYGATAGSAGRMWPSYDTSGQSIDHWANNQDAIWQKFDTMVQTYGQPKAVWTVVCSLAPTSADQIAQAIKNLKSRVPTAAIYLGTPPPFDPNDSGLCPMAPKGKEVLGYMDQNIQAGLAVAGPTFQPLARAELDPNIFYCDPNEAGKMKMGKQLVDFFDKI